MEERVDFVEQALRNEVAFVVLCRQRGISPKTGYKWLARFRANGRAGLEDVSRARKTQTRVSKVVEKRLLALKATFPQLGPKKLLVLLRNRFPGAELCSPSTAGDILNRHGLVQKRPRRGMKSNGPSPGLLPVTQPNGTWSVDFKGDFLLGNQQRCWPLTLTDNFSRMLLRCHALPGTDKEPAKRVLTGAFYEYGLPDVVRMDNGTPFASNQGGLGLSALAVYFLRLGIHPEYIARGKPQENGRHERMHKTLKQDTLKPPSWTMENQQRRFDEWRQYFNHVRPHEALGQEPPALHHQPSMRPMPKNLPELEYAPALDVRRVAKNGVLSFEGMRYRVSKTLAHDNIGIEPLDNNLFRMWFGTIIIGYLDPETQRFIPGIETDTASKVLPDRRA